MPRTAKFARVLSVLHNEGFLADSECSGPIHDFIRKATEPPSYWHATSHFRSQAATAVLAGHTFTSKSKYQDFCSEQLSHEHIVPNKVLHTILLAEPTLTEALIHQHLRHFGLRATITRSEKTGLREEGFQAKMPAGFWLHGDPLHMDRFARYKLLRLESGSSLYETLQPLQGPSWV